MDVEKIKINGISFGRDTDIEEVLSNPKFQPYVNGDGSVCVFSAEHVPVDGYVFNVKIIFINEKLGKIQMTPVNLEIKDPGYPDKKYQEEKKKVSDSFLRKNLGNPSIENEAVLCYEFDWGRVSSVAFLSGRNEHSGGFIEISYQSTTRQLNDRA